MRKRIKKPEIKSNNRVKSGKRRLKELEHKLRFSFKYLESNEKFNIEKRQTKYFLKLIGRLQDLSQWDIEQLKVNNSKSLRFNPIDWDYPKVTEDGFGIKQGEEFDDNAWEFSVSANEDGRVHGFLIENVFYIVWFDPEHNLFDEEKNNKKITVDKKPYTEFLDGKNKHWVQEMIDSYENKIKTEKNNTEEALKMAGEMETRFHNLKEIICHSCKKKALKLKIIKDEHKIV